MFKRRYLLCFPYFFKLIFTVFFREILQVHVHICFVAVTWESLEMKRNIMLFGAGSYHIMQPEKDWMYINKFVCAKYTAIKQKMSKKNSVTCMFVVSANQRFCVGCVSDPVQVFVFEQRHTKSFWMDFAQIFRECSQCLTLQVVHLR